MNLYKNIDDIPEFKNAVITIGSFDGVHLGHAEILRQLKQEAESINGEMVVITFFPHPKQIIGSKDIFMLNTPSEKYSLLSAYGINHIVEIPFTRDFADIPAEEYISEFLVKNFKPHTIIIGYDHRFGKNRCGDFRMLEIESVKFDFVVKEIPKHVLQNITISSTAIRNALLKGEVEKANELLGYFYPLSGIVVQGDKRGREIGFPTANIQVHDTNKLIPGKGVYIVKVIIDEKTYKGMLNIGSRPTFNGSNISIEVYILNFNESIYGKNIKVEFIKWLRPEIKFSGIEQLKKQLEEDKKNLTEYNF